MSHAALSPRSQPTMYFVGVTTGQSAILRVFPQWSAILGLDAQLIGYDCPLHAPPEDYRAIVRHVRDDHWSLGALVTTHKIDLLAATRAEFGYLDPYARLCGEISSISKRDGLLRGHAKDVFSSGLALDAFVPPGHFTRTGGQVLCLGAGGAATAISVALTSRTDRPSRVLVVDPLPGRLAALRDLVAKLQTDIAFTFFSTNAPAENDRLMADLTPGSLVINATGMGKDRPGSPVTGAVPWPVEGLVWDLNYRGDLDFLHQAQRWALSRGLTLEDGWVYFLHGWTQVVAEVFDVDLTPDVFAELEAAAADARPAESWRTAAGTGAQGSERSE